ncbi:MAG TPA: class I SAM-dependent methyltransferase [Solirubrobacteraceae bacterium]|nr:class I SAM-dependent methyltransferase [Solirubrobacteraceae bacterium]
MTATLSPSQVEGWLTDAQAGRLAAAARRVPAGERIVEIGSFRGKSTIVLAQAASEGVEVVAIDPHLGVDRAPQETSEDADAGQSDFEQFTANLAAHGVSDRVTHVRRKAEEALGDVPGELAVLYVDGAHSFRFAHYDLTAWGDRVQRAGTMLVHDSFSSIGVTLALLKVTFLGRKWRYVGRSTSMAEFRREDLGGRAWLANLARQAAQLPWFVRNVIVKALIVAKLRPVARLLGHTSGPWPY